MATILIVDDEEPVREFVAQVLSENGYDVRVASNGREALELVDQHRPDLVLSDVMMPLLNGRELSRALKDRQDTRDIPIILMTAGGPRAVDGAGANAFLAKPFDLDALEALVGRLIPA